MSFARLWFGIGLFNVIFYWGIFFLNLSSFHITAGQVELIDLSNLMEMPRKEACQHKSYKQRAASN